MEENWGGGGCFCAFVVHFKDVLLSAFIFQCVLEHFLVRFLGFHAKISTMRQNFEKVKCGFISPTLVS